jgi:hypothetical protein
MGWQEKYFQWSSLKNGEPSSLHFTLNVEYFSSQPPRLLLEKYKGSGYILALGY